LGSESSMADNKKQAVLGALPSVNDLLIHPASSRPTAEYGRNAVKYAARLMVENARGEAIKTGEAPSVDEIAERMRVFLDNTMGGSLIPVINGTGIILHTNLGRAPLGEGVIEEIRTVATGYSNLEFDLETGKRGNRSFHVREMMKILTGAEDVAVVNNNAAGLVLALSTLAKDKEVIISRGELIEIGGSFRLPDIMATSGAIMIEVGTTNRTRLSDYEQAITPNTALIFKAHTSNFSIQGFTEEVGVKELATFAHENNLPLLYDIGSGLLRKPEALALGNEPDVQGALSNGADLVAFSGDKLLGGPQAGILAGKKEIVKQLHGAPLMRALRVCKLTYAALSAVCRHYLKDNDLTQMNPTFATLEQSRETLEARAADLKDSLAKRGVEAKIAPSSGQCGGGTLPNLKIPSLAVEIVPQKPSTSAGDTFAERLFGQLLRGRPPILGVLREGKILFDVLTLGGEDLEKIAEHVECAIKGRPNP